MATTPYRVHLPAIVPAEDGADLQAQARREGRSAKELAGLLLTGCGFVDIRADVKVAGLGIDLDLLARDRLGGEWAFDVSGGFTSNRAGLRRADALWKALARASVLHEGRPGLPLVLLTTDTPAPRSTGAMALAAVLGPGRPVLDVVELLAPEGHVRLEGYAEHGPPAR